MSILLLFESVKFPEERKVVGVIWNTERDTFVFRFDALLEAASKIPRTKRGLLQLFPRLYDLPGFVSPIVVPLKVLFSRLCKLQVSWDEPLTIEHSKIIENWLRDLAETEAIEFPRYVLSVPITSIRSLQLIAFGDASKVAFGGVVYARVVSDEGIDVNLVTSKSRVAPAKEQTLPRLELLGDRVAAQTIDLVRSVMEPIVPIENEYYFSDSKTALCWIRNKHQQFKQFVDERARHIRELTDESRWMHVKGEENPADLTTRGVLASELKNNEFWYKGPSWLRLPIDQWPVNESYVEVTDESVVEMRAEDRKRVEQTEVMLAVVADDVIDVRRFSSLQRLLRVTAYVKRFVHNTRNKLDRKSGELSTEEIQQSELTWIRSVQREFKDGSKGSEDILRNLNCFVDENEVIRCRGRLENMKCDNNARFPILIPKKHSLSMLIVKEAHDRVLHGGVNDTMVYVRNKFWIPQLRQRVRQIVHKCFVCRLIDGKPYSCKKLPPLPEFRVAIEQPFSSSGADFAGPLYVKTVGIDRQRFKSYILLITCMATRAVHLEIVPDLSSSACIRALRRFIARRGCPKLIISDNAKTFKAEETRNFLRDRGVNWKFIMPRAPWQGGVYERMVRSTKRCLKKVLRNASLSYEELETVIYEVECVINSRPLTYIDTDGCEEPVTPNHLMFGHNLHLANNEPSAIDSGDSKISSKRRFLYRQKLLRDFQARWTREYLATLRERHRIPKTNTYREANVGDVVLVGDDAPRLSWRMGRIEGLIESRDGICRGARVKLSKTRNVVSRPLNVLYPLEESVSVDKSIEGARENVVKVVESESESGGGVSNKEEYKAAPQPSEPKLDDNSEVDIEPQSRPRRAAAINSDNRRRLLKQQ